MKFKVTSPFGALEEIRNGKPHTGIDFSMEVGTPIHAIEDGFIRLKDFGDTNAGKTVLLEMEDGKTAIFGHLKEFVARDGMEVEKGDLIAYSGNSGHSTGPHLHFGLKDSTGYLDPSGYASNIQEMGSQSFWDRFIENGQVNQYERVDFSVWQNVFETKGPLSWLLPEIPFKEIAVLTGVIILLLMIKPIRAYVMGIGAAVLLVWGVSGS
jgi:murein DD-endopeptidase MepM/ murein hydrolase activator NlpD